MTDDRDDPAMIDPRANHAATTDPRANHAATTDPRASRSTAIDDVESLPALSATIEPLPGGLAELRRRLRAPARARVPLGVALAAACCAAIAVWLLRPPPPPVADRAALRRLLVDSSELPHPLAVELGLVDRGRPVVAADPRIAASDTAVFFWVPPAER